MFRKFSRSAFLFALFAVALSEATIAEEPIRVEIETPKGWRTETLSLPTGFAKDMKLTGFEEVRFAPGMFRNGKSFVSPGTFAW